MRNDPIVVYENILKERGWIDQEAIDRMHESVKQEIEESIEFAEQSEPPPLDALYEDITVAPYHPAGVIMAVLIVSRSPEPGDDRGDGARRQRLPDGRGGRASTTAPTRSARACSSSSAPRRVVDTPISEEGFAGIGIGAAMVGLRPIIEFMTFSFSLVAIDQIVNNAANMRYMSGGQFAVPIVFRGSSGMAGCLAATHSHRLEAWYAQVPGLTVILPATPGRRQGAAQERDPLGRPGRLHRARGPLPRSAARCPRASTWCRSARPTSSGPGSDVTLITYSRSLKATLAAAEKLADEEIDAEVIDLRTIRPLDLDALLASVPKTHRAVIVEEDWPYCGLGAGISDRITQASSTSSTRRSAAWRPRTRRSPTTGPSRPRCSRSVDRGSSPAVSTMCLYI